MKTKIKKPIRSKSGITPLTVVLPPKKCDHGTCIYCPGGDFVPQSYTDKSPAIMRAMALKYDIKKQVKTRLESLKKMGHPTEKLEVIIIGGTFLQYSKSFKQDYIKGIYDTLNKKSSKNLEEAKLLNQNTKHRIIALCIENRPDNCSEKEIKEMLNYGATRIEIGVQIPDNKIYEKTNRGHTVKEVIQATKRLKNAGFKVGYHIMPGLPYSNKKLDKKRFKEIFSKQKFRPDQLKIYPCQIIESSPLAKVYKKINYKPYDNKEIEEFIIWMMNKIPRYCRVMRMMREIPKEKILENVASTSMRGNLAKRFQSKSKMKEIRFREIGQQRFPEKIDAKNLKLKTKKYSASKGKEYFIEIVNKEDILFGLLRLRINYNKKAIKERLSRGGGRGCGWEKTTSPKAIIRELHIYGQALKLHERSGNSQHRGFGKELIKKAEEIAKKNKAKTLKIISGVGVREYYKNQGYNLDKDKIYMEKEL